MDWSEKLNVRFHYNGEFLHDGKKMHYCGGTVAMSYIDHNKVSLPELTGHLKDHNTVLDGTLLHWLIPGRELHDGLRALVDDKACLDMLRCTDDGFFLQKYMLRHQLHKKYQMMKLALAVKTKKLIMRMRWMQSLKTKQA